MDKKYPTGLDDKLLEGFLAGAITSLDKGFSSGVEGYHSLQINHLMGNINALKQGIKELETNLMAYIDTLGESSIGDRLDIIQLENDVSQLFDRVTRLERSIDG